jgi:hypothetical protein
MFQTKKKLIEKNQELQIKLVELNSKIKIVADMMEIEGILKPGGYPGEITVYGRFVPEVDELFSSVKRYYIDKIIKLESEKQKLKEKLEQQKDPNMKKFEVTFKHNGLKAAISTIHNSLYEAANKDGYIIGDDGTMIDLKEILTAVPVE